MKELMLGAAKLRLLAVACLFGAQATGAVINDVEQPVWAIASPCQITEPNLLRIELKPPFSIFLLTEHCRRVALAHACSKARASGEREVVAGRGSVKHCEAEIEGGMFFYYTRDDGRPSRIA